MIHNKNISENKIYLKSKKKVLNKHNEFLSPFLTLT